MEDRRAREPDVLTQTLGRSLSPGLSAGCAVYSFPEESYLPIKPVPEGYGTVTPYLVIRGAERAIEWYKQAFGAEEIHRSMGPNNRIMHAEIRIGSSVVMFCDEFPEMT